MRTLIHIPIVHSEVDLGSLAGELRRQFQESFGAAEWSQRVATVDSMWNHLRRGVLSLPLPWAKTRVYQDALPICGRERDIVQDLAAQGSQNHLLLNELAGKGAALTGTENPELLLKEYRRAQRLAEAARSPAPHAVMQELSREGEALLRERDDFIVRRIGETLQEGETGLLFIGLLHQLDGLLHTDIELRQLTQHLPLRASPGLQQKA